MSTRTKATKERNSFFGVINHPKKENASKADFEALSTTLIKSYSQKFFYAMIIHDRDKLEDGKNKTIHMHLWLDVRDHNELDTKAVIEMLSNDLNIPKECISLEEAVNDGACVRYLLHKDKKDQWKVQYSSSEIITNSPNELKPLLLNDFEVLQYATSKKELYELRDLRFMKEYSKEWNDIRTEESQTDYLRQMNRLYDAYFWTIDRLVNTEDIYKNRDHLIKQLDKLRKDIELYRKNNKF